MNKNFIKYSKIQLYKLLLKEMNEDLDENEVHIMYYLARDKDIQEYLETVLDDVKNNDKTSF